MPSSILLVLFVHGGLAIMVGAMSVATFNCPGCGNCESYAALGILYSYRGALLVYSLCRSCSAAKGKKFDAILERAELALLPAEGSA